MNDTDYFPEKVHLNYMSGINFLMFMAISGEDQYLVNAMHRVWAAGKDVFMMCQIKPLIADSDPVRVSSEVERTFTFKFNWEFLRGEEIFTAGELHRVVDHMFEILKKDRFRFDIGVTSRKETIASSSDVRKVLDLKMTPRTAIRIMSLTGSPYVRVKIAQNASRFVPRYLHLLAYSYYRCYVAAESPEQVRHSADIQSLHPTLAHNRFNVVFEPYDNKFCRDLTVYYVMSVMSEVRKLLSLLVDFLGNTDDLKSVFEEFLNLDDDFDVDMDLITERLCSYIGETFNSYIGYEKGGANEDIVTAIALRYMKADSSFVNTVISFAWFLWVITESDDTDRSTVVSWVTEKIPKESFSSRSEFSVFYNSLARLRSLDYNAPSIEDIKAMSNDLPMIGSIDMNTMVIAEDVSIDTDKMNIPESEKVDSTPKASPVENDDLDLADDVPVHGSIKDMKSVCNGVRRPETRTVMGVTLPVQDVVPKKPSNDKRKTMTDFLLSNGPEGLNEGMYSKLDDGELSLLYAIYIDKEPAQAEPKSEMTDSEVMLMRMKLLQTDGFDNSKLAILSDKQCANFVQS